MTDVKLNYLNTNNQVSEHKKRNDVDKNYLCLIAILERIYVRSYKYGKIIRS